MAVRADARRQIAAASRCIVHPDHRRAHRLGTERPVRPRVVGLDDPDLPGRSTVYVPVTPLPMESIVETVVHPGGFAQNVLATGDCWIAGSGRVAGREAIVVECDHPRTIEIDNG